MFFVILNVQCFSFGFLFYHNCFLDHTCLYNKNRCIGEMKM